jgi:RimJ/RimL family protein N-acetyltransferase
MGRFTQKVVTMDRNLFLGELVRLTAGDPEVVAHALNRWGRNSEYLRLLDSSHAYQWSAKKIKEWIEKEQEEDHNFNFLIHTLENDQLIGFIGLGFTQWNHGEAWMGIGIGENHLWGKGYGADAMRVLLRYAFTELNLNRVSLGVFSYNPRAIRSYEKVGFVCEGRERQVVHRDGSRADMMIMGILRQEWEAKNL